MCLRRTILRVLVVVIGLVATTALVLYAIASRTPAAYRPLNLNEERQNDRLHEFVNHVTDFNNRAGAGESFAWTITAEQANAYLASVDAIASLPYSHRVHAMARMEEAGFSNPAVAMRDGVLTVMVRQRKYNKIVSADLAFATDEAGLMTVRIVGVRIGRLPVPEGLLDEKLAEARARLLGQLEEAEQAPDARIAGVDLDRVAGLLRQVVRMLDGRGIDPVIRWRHHRARIDRVEVADGRLTLYVSPADRRPTTATSASLPADGG